MRARRGDDVLRHWMWANRACLCAFLTTYCVGNLIGSALAKLVDRLEMQSERFLVDQ